MQFSLLCSTQHDCQGGDKVVYTLHSGCASYCRVKSAIFIIYFVSQENKMSDNNKIGILGRITKIALK